MKKIILSLAFVGGMFAFSANLSEFTAVTSGAWSSAATWGGVGPGSTVLNQDIIIPVGITVDMDMDITFDGLLNSFQTNGTLMNSADHALMIQNGSFNGAGTFTVHRLEISGLLTTYSFSGPMTVDILRNNGAVVSLGSAIIVNDTLDLEQGVTTIGSNGVLQMALNSNVRVNDGTLTNTGGTFLTGVPYDVWYFGSTKLAGEEVNSASVHDVNVMLNSNSDNLTLTANTTVNGTLNMVAGHVILNGSQLTLNGDLTRNTGSVFESSATSRLVIAGTGMDLSSPLEFSAGSSIDELEIDKDTFIVHLASDLDIIGHLRLTEGALWIDTAATLTMTTGSWVTVIMGYFGGNGTFDGSQSYNVEYVGETYYAGVELTGSGLNDVHVYLWSNRDLWLTQDVTVNGQFLMIQGDVRLAGNDLTLNGTFDQFSTTAIWGHLQSSMILSMSSTSDDTLWMSIPQPSLWSLKLDLPAASSTVTIGNNLGVHELDLTHGRIDAGDARLYIGQQGGYITNHDDSNYVVTSGTGSLVMFVAYNSVYTYYPVGTAADYTPVEIQQVNTAQPGYIRVRVMEGVWTNGLTGTDVSGTQSVVNKTWFIEEDSVPSLDMNIRFGWSGNCEVNGFDNQMCFAKNYNNNMWDSYAPGMANSTTFNTMQIERMGLPNGGPFAVVDDNSPLTVTEPVAGDFGVFPNPSSDVVNVQISNPDNSTFRYELFDAAGRKVLGIQNANTLNQLDLRNYENGSYTMRVTNLTTNEVVTRLIIKS